jgi:fluoride exporter
MGESSGTAGSLTAWDAPPNVPRSVTGAVPYLVVALGGALGAVARVAISNLFVRRIGVAWPYGTLFINVTGCLVIALFITYFSDRELNPNWRYFFPTGFVGAYTTFSTYEYELIKLVESRSAAGAAAYFVLSNGLGFVACLLGIWLGRRP